MILWYFVALLLAVGLVVNCNIGIQWHTDTNQTIVVSMSALKAGSVIVGWMAENIPNLVCQVTWKRATVSSLHPRFDDLTCVEYSWISIFQRFVSLSVLTCRVVIQELSRPQRPGCSTSQFALKGTQIETRSSLKQFKSMRPTFTRVKFRVCLKLKLWLRGVTSKASSCQNCQAQPEKYAGSAILWEKRRK